MSSCKELPVDSIEPQGDSLLASAYGKFLNFKHENPSLYKGIILSLLGHLGLFSIFFLISFLFPDWKEDERISKAVTIPVEMISVQIGQEAIAEASHSAVAQPQPVIQPQMSVPDVMPESTMPETVTKTPVKEKAPPIAKRMRLKSTAAAVSGATNKTRIEKQENVPNTGSELGNSADSEQLLRSYEQMLALWLEKHKVSPPITWTGKEGDALLRIRINRAGTILLYKLERSTGNQALDDAVLTMVTQSNPVPPIPLEYTGDNQVEFLLPISFNGAGADSEYKPQENYEQY
jgi:TonB family protein